MTQTPLTIDKVHSQATFSLKKLGLITVKGVLTDFEGQIAFDENDLANSYFDVCIQANTIDSGNPKRDEHLKTPDFFSVEKHPTICFKSSAINKASGQYIATGRLTILQTVQEVEIPFDYQQGTFSGTLSINRLDYELGAKFPTVIVGKTVQISITCTAQ
ncbi:MAG: YceI family protein [Bacteroidota bacterium]